LNGEGVVHSCPGETGQIFQAIKSNVNAGKLMLPQLIDSRNVGQLIFEFHWWTVDFTASRISLLTSDRPLVMTNGLQKERCVIALPLSPRLAFSRPKTPKLLKPPLNALELLLRRGP